MKFIHQDSNFDFFSLNEYASFMRSGLVDDNGYNREEASLSCCGDTKKLKTILELKDALVTDKLKYVFVIGIGGSNLGAVAVYDALFGYCDGVVADRFPKIFFLDTLNSTYIAKFEGFLENINNPQEILINIITKSGTTLETIALAEYFLRFLSNWTIDDIKKRTVIISDEGSAFLKNAIYEGYNSLTIPSRVGGRYSVFSSVGLFPLACVGIDIESLVTGALAARESSLQSNSDAMRSAVLLYDHYQKGRHIHDTFFFNSELESLGKWYRQLIGESCGKELSVGGTITRVGITPTVSIGTADLHSVAQLYLAGPDDRYTTFVFCNQGAMSKITESRFFPNNVPEITNFSMNEMMSAIYNGVKISYGERNLSCSEILLDEINAYELGYYLQFKMVEVMYLGKLFSINPFDQPAVESYKREARRILLENR